MHAQHSQKTYVMQRSYSWNYSKLLFLLAPPGMVPSHIRNSKVTWPAPFTFCKLNLHCQTLCTNLAFALEGNYPFSFFWVEMVTLVPLRNLHKRYLMGSINKSHNLVIKWKLSQRKDNTPTSQHIYWYDNVLKLHLTSLTLHCIAFNHAYNQ